MAQRRMFSKKITETDLFLDMPMSTQCLYFHLNMAADDDGFIGNVKTAKRMIGASDDDLKLLMAKEFIIPFESGVVVIKDWKIHNYIRSDRYAETVYLDEKEQLSVSDNGRYVFGAQKGIPNDIPDDIPKVDGWDTQVRLGKDRLGKGKKEILSGDAEPSIPFSEIISYLNEKTERSFKPVESHRKNIRARWNEGYRTDDFKKVVDNKCADWLQDEKMSKYLQPSTLFGTKFDQYLNQVPTKPRKGPDSYGGIVY
ncbi:conserved phage C-terminal domain-containing protein [Trichococcus collinsii]|uniref:Phage conserved hypothetical protein C-terminal domain-containing protein n=1 Tax=Trichococcus collinsii TaxID=157076 RepID=A0AB37ZXG8_9LACT|nr:conserved phage C-terminal domain-containing protein [Trichococcus collinsii]CZR02749.1 Hypothetical protein Tcol_2075 [Trichococcus collinsii]SDZ96497.1 phage conserved hypothetical protein, C-terminal domain-containing protein [Trichococcus collinsii]